MRGYANQVMFEVEPMVGETRVIAGVRCTFIDTGLCARYSGESDGARVTALPPINGSPWAVAIVLHGVGAHGLGEDIDDAAGAALAKVAAVLVLSILSSLASAVAS